MIMPNGNYDMTKPQYDNNVAVSKDSVADLETFKQYISLFNLTLLRTEDKYYILHGDNKDIQEFIDSWNTTE